MPDAGERKAAKSAKERKEEEKYWGRNLEPTLPFASLCALCGFAFSGIRKTVNA